MLISHSSSSVDLLDYAKIKQVFATNFVSSRFSKEKVVEKLKQLYAYKYGKVLNSGSNSLLLALKALMHKWEGKNEVLVGGYVCTSVINVILSLNLKPIFIDTNEDNLNINNASLFNNITEKTLVVILTNIGGYPDLLLKELTVPYILDVCQSLGTKVNHKLNYYEADFIIFSFGSTKVITAGVGGALLTNNEEFIARIDFLSQGEHSVEFYEKNGFMPSYEYDISAMDAYLIDSQLDKLNYFIERRIYIAKNYDQIFNEFGYKILKFSNNIECNYYRYYIISSKSNHIIKQLHHFNIDARSSIAHNFSNYFKNSDNRIINLRRLSNKIVSIPIYPSLDDNKLDYIKEKLKSILKNG